MRKIIDGLAIFAGVVSLAIVGTGGYVYLQREEITENVKSRVSKAITAALTDALPVAIDAEVPKIPKATGPAIPTLPGK
tara:strand:+ start:10831 stop:11067 length:237 start_codon:yes stop_codon:yes gene_type:complete